MAKRKLLLADDSMTIQKVVNLTFAAEDIEVTAVSDGDAAMLKFAENMPDLVLADVNMPGLDGYEICERIKQDEKTNRIPVVLLVGSFEPFDEEKAERVGADDFLTKPFQSIKLLVDKVSGLLEAKRDEENFLHPIENPDDPVSSFADTLEMMPTSEFDTADESIENLGDAGMDDEMIETSQIGSVPVDEFHKFESAPVYQSFAEDLDRTALKASYNSEKTADYPPDEDWAKTQPLSKADLEEIRNSPDKKQNAPLVDFDELDLLDFPRATTLDASNEIIPDDFAAEIETPEEKTAETSEISARQDETEINSTHIENISPELIEAIADKVADRISNKVVKQIVREVMAQMERKK